MTEYIIGSTVRCENDYVDSQSSNPFDPTSITLEIFSADGTLKETKTILDLENPSVGSFYYDYTVGTSEELGDWLHRWTAVYGGQTVVKDRYFTIVENVTQYYCTIPDVYRRAGIDNTVISDKQIKEHILDAQGEVDELFDKSFYDSTSITEWFDTLNSHEDESVEGKDKFQLFLRYRPVQTITSMESYDESGTLVKTWTSDDYWIDQKTGILTLRDNETFTSQRQRVKLIYTYGYPSVPRSIKKLTATIAAMAALIQQIGGTYDDVTSYSLPTGVSVSVGEPYMNMLRDIEKLEKEYTRIVGEIGLLRDNVVII